MAKDTTNEFERKFVGSYGELERVNIRHTNFPAKVPRYKISAVQMDKLLKLEYFNKIFRKGGYMPRFFVASDDKGRIVYVNTEGYDYARYMARGR